MRDAGVTVIIDGKIMRDLRKDFARNLVLSGAVILLESKFVRCVKVALLNEFVCRCNIDAVAVTKNFL